MFWDFYDTSKLYFRTYHHNEEMYSTRLNLNYRLYEFSELNVVQSS